MKKIFLPLLALVGMAGGLMFTSCSGGGGDKEGPAYAFAGKTIYLWPNTTPSLRMDFAQPSGSHICNVTYTAGGGSSSSGLYSIREVGTRGDGWLVQGVVNIHDDDILLDQSFSAAVTGSNQQDIVALNDFIIHFYVNRDGTPASEGASVFIEGTYGGSGDGEGGALNTLYPKSAQYHIVPVGSGKLAVEYFEEKPYNPNTVEPEEDIPTEEE